MDTRWLHRRGAALRRGRKAATAPMRDDIIALAIIAVAVLVGWVGGRPEQK
ncbi:hypothetical protein [Bifidobacterium animalis]|uniref:hypothetical protein n=1 Tax=Bifidobacterium animalis TaxID=28025 RepID=UPI001C3EA66D|nr:hypothetical protein [Bifidobacterium animalis]MCR1995716.1 hypothetical protein [Bifidobacterium animalis subsp. animalis]